MKLYPLNVIEFQDAFPTVEACYAYLCLVKWPEGFVCPQCKFREAWKLKRFLLKCKSCRKDISVTAGTIFQDRHMPLRLIFQAMWYIVCQKQGVSALSLQEILGVGSYETVWTWLHKLRTAMVRPGRELLSGTVEVDETFVGGEKVGKRGRGAEGKELVLVAVEDHEKKGIGRIRFKHIPDASSKTLEVAVSELVAPGSTVRTDGWRGYNTLEKQGFIHTVVKHKVKEPGEDSTPLVHRVASLLKRWLLGTHQGALNFSHLHYYLDEFTFRFNRRTSKSRGQLFYRLVQQALQVEPAPLVTLKAS
ncbi:MAG: IS1595 family transposase [Candidatus Levyibacteriota bacterium]